MTTHTTRVPFLRPLPLLCLLLAAASFGACSKNNSPSLTSPTATSTPSSSPEPSRAGLRTYVHDCAGVLATVDVTTGAVAIVGSTGLPLTDIAAAPNGELYGMTARELYAINTVTAQPRLIGTHAISGGNALVFGADGTLYGAGAFTTQLYRLDPQTGRATGVGNMGFGAGGDLAFSGGNFYVVSIANQLVRLNLSNLPSSAVVGSLPLPDVYGLVGTPQGELYAAGGSRVVRVDPSTAATMSEVTFTGDRIGAACGQSLLR